MDDSHKPNCSFLEKHLEDINKVLESTSFKFPKPLERQQMNYNLGKWQVNNIFMRYIVVCHYMEHVCTMLSTGNPCEWTDRFPNKYWTADIYIHTELHTGEINAFHLHRTQKQQIHLWSWIKTNTVESLPFLLLGRDEVTWHWIDTGSLNNVSNILIRHEF